MSDMQGKIQKQPPLEDIEIKSSEVIEEALLQIGEIIANTFLQTDRYDEALILHELSGAFNYAAGCYGDKTGRIRQDLGVSLSEATLMKCEAFRRSDSDAPADNEWCYFAKDAQKTIVSEQIRRTRG